MRESVRWFANEMESKLRDNDHKGGRDDCSYVFLMHRLDDEFNELVSCLEDRDYDGAIEECADIANFAMMIADKTRGGECK